MVPPLRRTVRSSSLRSGQRAARTPPPIDRMMRSHIDGRDLCLYHLLKDRRSPDDRTWGVTGRYLRDVTGCAEPRRALGRIYADAMFRFSIASAISVVFS